VITCWPSLYRPAEGRASSDRALFERVKAPRTYAAKDAVPRCAGAKFRDGYRSLASLLRVDWLALDFDFATSATQLVEAFGDLCGVGHTTWSPGRWRVWLLLDRPIALADDEFQRVQRAAIELAERHGLRPEHGQSAAHCFALPALGGAPYEHVEFTGALFDVDAARERFPKPEPLPEPARADRTDSYDRRLDRARRYLEKMPGAVSGSHGHITTFRAAVAMVRGFGLEPDDALRLLVQVHNPTCAPVWSERELVHKVRQAWQRARLPFGAIADRARERRSA
jgi:hypothetical protein